MAQDKVIAGLGSVAEHVAPSPRFDAAAAKLTDDERVVLAAVGPVRQLGELLTSSGLDETRTIVALLTLRAKGVLVKATVKAPPPKRNVSAAIAEKVDLDDALKARILELEELLDTADHFTLLGVPPDTDAAAVKKTFFKLSHRLHPDRYFRKNLGSFRSRLDKVFRTLSRAHQTLTDPVKRAAYLDAHPELRRGPPPAPEAAPGAPPGSPAPGAAIPAPSASAPVPWQTVAPGAAPRSPAPAPATPELELGTWTAPADPAALDFPGAPLLEAATEEPAAAYAFPSAPMLDASQFEDPAEARREQPAPAAPAPPAPPAAPAPRVVTGRRMAFNISQLPLGPAVPDPKGEKK